MIMNQLMNNDNNSILNDKVNSDHKRQTRCMGISLDVTDNLFTAFHTCTSIEKCKKGLKELFTTI